jgi:putative membrane-bound dehydrogenase-like protein
MRHLSIVLLFGLIALPPPLTVDVAVIAQDDKANQSLKNQLPRISATEPDKALATFTVQDGFRLELIASEPLVSDPVDACFDERGRMFVCEMHGYPYSQEPTRLYPSGGGKKDAGVIRMLTDTNGDGKLDKATKYADGIRWPTSVISYKGGVFVLAPPRLWYFKDLDNDGVADQRTVIYDGFSRDNVQGLANNMKWGKNHRIYLAGGRNPSKITHKGKQIITVGRSDFSFAPHDPTDVRPETGGAQFGHTFDDWGNRFVCSNSNHIQQIVLPYEFTTKSAIPFGGMIRSISAEGAAAPVFRKSSAEPWRIVRTRRRVADPRFKGLPATERVAIGFFTSATGISVYKGNAWPKRYRGQVFIGDVGGNLVHRKILKPDGVHFKAFRADQNAEFIASTDNWFRPTNFVNAPDGTLYVLDMYRETIEHPYSISEDIKAFLDLESGDDRGRIYRLVHKDSKIPRVPVEDLSKLSLKHLVFNLGSPNGWIRETARRLICESDTVPEIVLALRGYLESNPNPQGLVNALWCVRAKTDSLVTAEFATVVLVWAELARVVENSTDLGVRRQVLRVLGSTKRGTTSRSLLAGLVKIAGLSDSAPLRFEAALQLQRLPIDESKELQQLFVKLIRDSDSLVRNAALMAINPSLARNNLLLIATGNTPASVTSTVIRIALSDSLPKHADEVFELLRKSPLNLRVLLLTELDSMAHKRGFSLSDAANIKSTNPKITRVLNPDQRSVLAGHFEAMAITATDNKAQLSGRVLSVSGLSFAGADVLKKHVLVLVSPQVSEALQIAAVHSLLKSSSQFHDAIVERWKSLGPVVRAAFVERELQQIASTSRLLESVSKGDIPRTALATSSRQFLLNHANSKIASAAKKIYSGDLNPDRAATVRKFQKALELVGNVDRGAMLFKKNCSVCHRVGKDGHKVGPDIVSVKNKSPSDLLISILDPNREAQPNFTSYTVITDGGRVLNGIISQQTATTLTLLRAESKTDTVQRSDIDQLVSSGKSLMPEGLEKEIKQPQDVADIIAFIKSIQTAK